MLAPLRESSNSHDRVTDMVHTYPESVYPTSVSPVLENTSVKSLAFST